MRNSLKMRRSGAIYKGVGAMLQPLATIESAPTPRLYTIFPLDYVTGGLPLGGSLLIGGAPGAGKSTLLLQAACAVRFPSQYFTAEEKIKRISRRASRLGLRSDNLQIDETKDVDEIADSIIRHRPALCVVDSIQTIKTSKLRSLPGSLSQVRAVTEMLCSATGEAGTALVLVCHETKSGGFAGPRAVEHLVDVVLRLEREPERRLISVKNRDDETPIELPVEITSKGVFAMSMRMDYYHSSQEEHDVRVWLNL
jgi:DNA repair protein RadA/Sms